MGYLDELFGGAQGVNSDYMTQTPGLPDWYQQALMGVAGRGFAVADEPYQQYTGQRFAPFAPEQQRAFDLTRRAVGDYTPTMMQARELAARSAEYDPEQFKKFLSPYTSGVVEEIGRLGQRQLTEQALPAALDPFTGGGQFGSTRSQEMAGRTVRDTMADIAGRQAAALQNAYDAAQGAYGQWAGHGLSGAGQMADLSRVGQQLGFQDIGALSAIGEQQRQLQQQNLDYAQQQFQEQRDYPMQQVGALSNIVQGLPSGSLTSQGRTSTAAQPVMSPFQQFLGGLTGLGSIT